MHGMKTMFAHMMLAPGFANLARQFLSGQTKAVVRSVGRVRVSQGCHHGLHFMTSLSFLTKLFVGRKQRDSKTLSTTLLEHLCTANFRTELYILQMRFLQKMLHLRKLRPCLGLLETEGLADDMFLGKRLLCFVSHPRDDMFLLLEMTMNLLALVHGLMKGLGFGRNGTAELRDDGGFLGTQLQCSFLTFC